VCSLPYTHLLANRLNRLQMKCALADGNAYGSRQNVCYEVNDNAASFRVNLRRDEDRLVDQAFGVSLSFPLSPRSLWVTP